MPPRLTAPGQPGYLSGLLPAAAQRLEAFLALAGKELAAAKLRWVHVMCTGIAVHDGLAAYRQYDTAEHALCNAHHLRELAGIAQLTGQDWPTELADLLVEIHIAVELARASGQATLPADQLEEFGRRYDALGATGKQLNPPPPRTGKRGRPALGPAGSLLARLHTHRADVLRFATDLRVPFDNYSDAAVMPKSA